MVHNMFWFVFGGWIGSFVTLIMVALLSKAREAPKPAARDAAQGRQPETGERGTSKPLIRANQG